MNDSFMFNLIRENLTDYNDITSFSVNNLCQRVFEECYPDCPFTINEFYEMYFPTYLDYEIGTLFWITGPGYLIEKQFRAKLADELWHIEEEFLNSLQKIPKKVTENEV